MQQLDGMPASSLSFYLGTDFRCSSEFSPWDPQRVLAMARERSEHGAWMARRIAARKHYVESEGLVSAMNHTKWRGG